MSQPGMVSHGMPPRENETQRDIADLQRQMRHLHGMIAQVITGAGGITINGGSLQSLYSDGKFSTRIGTFATYDANFNPITAVGLELDKDAEWSPGVQKAFMQVYRNQSSGASSFYVSADDVQMWRGAGQMRFAGSGTNQFILLDTNGNVVLAADTGATVQINSIGTTASTANVVIDASTGALARSTSSRRYKQDVTGADLDTDALLQLTPRRFRVKAEVERDGDDAPEHVGFIAEEAADLGLDEFVTCDEDGPEAFSYAGYVVGLQAIVRRQAEQIAGLTARLERLEKAEPTEEC